MIQKIFDRYKGSPVAVKATIWFLICSFIQKAISVISTPIFTRLLSTQEYGAYNVFNAWLNIITIFVSLNLGFGVYSQGVVKFSNRAAVFSSSLQGLSLMLCLFWTVVYLVFDQFWNQMLSLTTVQILAMLLMIWTTGVFGFWAAEQRVRLRYKELIAVTLLVSIAKPLVGIWLVCYAHDKVTARIVGLAIVEVIGYSWLFFVQMRNGRVFFSREFWSYALKFSIPLIPHYLSMAVLSNSDRIMIEKMIGSDKAGIYSLAYSVAMIMVLFNNSLMQTLSPWIYQKIKEKRAEEIAPVAYSALLIVASANLILIIFAPEIVKIFAPKEYYEAIWVIPPIAMSLFFTFSYDLFAKFEFYFEKTYFIALGSIMGAVLNILLNVLFIPHLGYISAAYTTLLCYIVFSAAHYFFMRIVVKTYMNGISIYNTKVLALTAIGFVVIGCMIILTYKTWMLRYSIILVCFVGLWLGKRGIKGQIQKIIHIKKNG